MRAFLLAALVASAAAFSATVANRPVRTALTAVAAHEGGRPTPVGASASTRRGVLGAGLASIVVSVGAGTVAPVWAEEEEAAAPDPAPAPAPAPEPLPPPVPEINSTLGTPVAAGDNYFPNSVEFNSVGGLPTSTASPRRPSQRASPVVPWQPRLAATPPPPLWCTIIHPRYLHAPPPPSYCRPTTSASLAASFGVSRGTRALTGD